MNDLIVALSCTIQENMSFQNIEIILPFLVIFILQMIGLTLINVTY